MTVSVEHQPITSVLPAVASRRNASTAGTQAARGLGRSFLAGRVRCQDKSMLASRLRTLQQAVGSLAMLTRSPSISAEGRCGSRAGCAMLPRTRVQPVLARSSCAMASHGRQQQLRASGTSSLGRGLGSTTSSVCALGSRPNSSSSIGRLSVISRRLRSFTTTAVFAARAKGEWIWTDEQREFWVGQLERLQRPQAIDAAALLDLAHPLGVPDLSQQKNRRQRPASPGSDSLDEGGRTTKIMIPPCWELYKASKLQHPLAIALIRIGSFYEAIGLDAVLLIEHCGLNPMGGLKKDVTRAGCPQDNVVGLLKQLVEDARLDVAVWEELPASDASYGQKATEQKERELRQLVTPEDPLYRFALERSGGGINVTPAFITGVVPTTSGLTLLDYNRASTRVLVFNGVSDDVMWGLLQRAGGGNQVVWLYEKLSDEPGSVASLQRRLAKGGVTVRRFRSADPQASFAAELKEFVGLDPATDIEFSPGVSFMEWPGVRPSYQSTLCQLGLIKTPGIPALESFLLLEGAPKVLRKLMASILWLPPSHTAAAATRRAMRQLMSHDGTLPGFKAVTHMTADRVQLMLSVAKPTGDVSFLLALAEVLGPVRAALDPNIRSPALAQMVSDMWPLLCHQLGSDPAEMTQEWVLQGVAQAQAAISRVVADPNSRRPGLSSTVYTKATWYDRQVFEAVMQLRDSQDTWSSKVKPELMKDEVDALQKAEGLLLETLLYLMHSLVVLGKSKSAHVNAHQNTSKLLGVKVDPSNCAIWLILPNTRLEHSLRDRSFTLPEALRPQGLASAAHEQLMRRPVARDGSDLKQKTLHTCDVLDEALNLYRSASGEANAAASGHINGLAQQLQQYWRQLAAAVQFSLLAAALSNHATAALRAGWTVPLVGPQEQLPYLRELERLKQQLAAAQLQQQQQQQSQQELEQQEQELRTAAAEVAAAAIAAASSSSSSSNGGSAGSSSAAESGKSVGELGLLQLQQLWPYWMAGSSSSTVKNDVAINGFILLTGPNMAGKSTVMRSVAAAALCGSCGLAVPAGAGSLLPLLDAVMLRTFSGDAPTDELSAFGVEMREMKFALADATQRSLVLIDELGKGTEVMSGTALSSTILRHLMHKGARGVFATHLHLLLQLLPDEPAIDFQRMDIAQRGGRAVPTWRMLPGSCTSSLALEVAEQQGMPREVLERARQELKTIHQLGYHTMAALGVAGSATASRNDASSSGSDSDDTSDGSSSSSGGRRRGRPRKIVQYESAAAAVEQLEASTAAPGPVISEVDEAAEAAAARLAEDERMQQQIALVVQQLTQLGSSNGSSSGSSVPVRGVATGVVHYMRDMSCMPSPAHVGLGVLYVLRFPDGCFYAGQTEDVGRRRDEHARRWAKRHGGPPQMWYVVPADQGARLALESQLVMALGAKGKKLRMLSSRDSAKARRR